MFLEEKIEGRKVQFLPFLLSKNMRKYTLKNTGFCPNKVIHFIILLRLISDWTTMEPFVIILVLTIYILILEVIYTTMELS